VRLELEWRIPWSEDWDKQKKVAAGKRLVDYMVRGSFYESSNRLKVERAGVVVPQVDNGDPDPYITITLES
jgi:hypothetical protein